MGNLLLLGLIVRGSICPVKVGFYGKQRISYTCS